MIRSWWNLKIVQRYWLELYFFVRTNGEQKIPYIAKTFGLSIEKVSAMFLFPKKDFHTPAPEDSKLVEHQVTLYTQSAEELIKKTTLLERTALISSSVIYLMVLKQNEIVLSPTSKQMILFAPLFLNLMIILRILSARTHHRSLETFLLMIEREYHFLGYQQFKKMVGKSFYRLHSYLYWCCLLGINAVVAINHQYILSIWTRFHSQLWIFVVAIASAFRCLLDFFIRCKTTR